MNYQTRTPSPKELTDGLKAVQEISLNRSGYILYWMECRGLACDHCVKDASRSCPVCGAPILRPYYTYTCMCGAIIYACGSIVTRFASDQVPAEDDII